ncbi:DUF45 domain-containing protein [Candidatus Woesearchaeota archaeon]|nr:DUF45 domain-containing protein [Candidatus Woesearchaeota archaeon]
MATSNPLLGILKLKKERFKEKVLIICKKRGIELPQINFEGCTGEGSDGCELAHCHTDERKICCSEFQLAKLNFDDIDNVVAHEVSHLLQPDHSAKFTREEELSGISSFDPSTIPGVVVIREYTSEVKKETKKVGKRELKPNSCEYHLCRKRGNLKLCPYCQKYFCRENLMPKIPGHYNVDGSNSKFFITNPEWKDTDGHPCPAFFDYTLQKEKERKEAWGQTLNRLVGRNRRVSFHREENDFADEDNTGSTYKESDKGSSPTNIRDEKHLKDDKSRLEGWGLESRNNPLIERNSKEYRHKKFKSGKKRWKIRLWHIIWIILVMFILFLFTQIKIDFSKWGACVDSTHEGNCSLKKPLMCSNRVLIEDFALCGCDPDSRLVNNSCIGLVECDDGTLSGQCSTNLPLRCVNGKLAYKAQECGCPSGLTAKGDFCKKI